MPQTMVKQHDCYRILNLHNMKPNCHVNVLCGWGNYQKIIINKIYLKKKGGGGYGGRTGVQSPAIHDKTDWKGIIELSSNLPIYDPIHMGSEKDKNMHKYWWILILHCLDLIIHVPRGIFRGNTLPMYPFWNWKCTLQVHNFKDVPPHPSEMMTFLFCLSENFRNIVPPLLYKILNPPLYT